MRDLYGLAIVGAGLSAMSFLGAHTSLEPAVVIDYQSRAGGFLRPVLPHPALAGASDLARSFRFPAGLDTLFNATAVGLLPSFGAQPHTVLVRTREGTQRIRAEQVVIASGGLEVTREHDQIPGSRPAGVVTPIFVHQLLDLGYLPGRRAVVYGGSRYAQATRQRLAEAGVDVLLVPAGGVPDESPPNGAEPAALIEVRGFPRVDAVVLRRGAAEQTVPADLLVYARGMAANSLWLKGSGIEFDDRGAVAVNDRFETNVPNVHAIGTVVMPDLDHGRSIAMGKELARVLGEDA